MALSGSFNTKDYNGRYLEFSWKQESQDFGNNTTTISWSLKGAGRSASNYWYCDQVKVYIDGDLEFKNKGRFKLYHQEVASGTKTIKHNPDGTRNFSASASAGIYYTGATNCSGSGSFDLQNIPKQAYITHAPNFTDIDNPIMTYSNPAGTYVQELKACISFDGYDDIAYRNVPLVGNEFQFVFTDSEREAIRVRMANEKKPLIVKYYLKTKINGEWLFGTKDAEMSIAGSTISFSPTIKNIDEPTIALVGNDTTFIKYYNKAQVDLNVSLYKHTVLSSGSATIGNETKSGVSLIFDNITTNSLTAKAENSQGRTVVYTGTFNMIDYYKPTIELTVDVPDTEGKTIIHMKGNYFNQSFGAKTNQITLKYRWGRTISDDTEWKKISPILHKDSYSVDVPLTVPNYRESYQFQAAVGDRLTPLIFTPIITKKATPVFDWGENDFAINVPLVLNLGEDKDILKKFKMCYGTESIHFGSQDGKTTITFPENLFKKAPVVMVSQVFNGTPLVVINNNITKENCIVAVAGVFSTSGDRDFNWFAIGE